MKYLEYADTKLFMGPWLSYDNSHIRHSRAGRALLRWRKECGRLWVQLASAVQALMHSVAYMYIDSY